MLEKFKKHEEVECIFGFAKGDKFIISHYLPSGMVACTHKETGRLYQYWEHNLRNLYEEPDWCVDCWGSFNSDWGTEVYHTKEEARVQFNKILNSLKDKSKYTITDDMIMEKENEGNSAHITKLSEL